MAHGHVAVMAKPFNPLNLAPTLWFDASDSTTITASSNKVSQWNDKSGNARHATQSTSSNQPTTGSATQNSLNTLTFSTVSTSYLTTSSGYDASTTGISAFFVTINSGGGIAFQQLDSGGTGRSWFLFTASSSQTFVGGVATNISGATTTCTLHRITIKSGASQTLTFSRNAGASSATTTTTIESSAGAYRIGASKAGTSNFNGNIAEIIVYPTLGAAAIDEVERYLNKKWAIY